MELWLTLAIVLSNWECKEKKNIIAKRSPYETIRTGQVFLSTFATRNIVIMYIGTLIWCQRRGLFNKISSREERIFYCQWSSYLITPSFWSVRRAEVRAPGSRFFVSILLFEILISVVNFSSAARTIRSPLSSRRSDSQMAQISNLNFCRDEDQRLGRCRI